MLPGFDKASKLQKPVRELIRMGAQANMADIGNAKEMELRSDIVKIMNDIALQGTVSVVESLLPPEELAFAKRVLEWDFARQGY